MYAISTDPGTIARVLGFGFSLPKIQGFIGGTKAILDRSMHVSLEMAYRNRTYFYMYILELCYKNLSLFKTSSLPALTKNFLRVKGNALSC
jgi:hypothetical protein